MGKSLFNKVWDLHKVGILPSGQDQLFVGLHLLHEGTSPQAFQMLRERNLKVRYPERTFATVDHMVHALETNAREFGVQLFEPGSEFQGIAHVIGPDLGLSQPGLTIACGDSHTPTHEALGAVAFGIGTSQVRDVLATQTVSMKRYKVRRIQLTGKLSPGVFSKDIILKVIAELGVRGGPRLRLRVRWTSHRESWFRSTIHHL